MKYHTLHKHILLNTFKIVLFYSSEDITPGFNGFFAAVPVSGYVHEHSTAQWHRDVIPALRRWVKARTGSTFKRVVSGGEGIEGEDLYRLLRNRSAKQNDRIWLAFCWEAGGKKSRRGCFKEVRFG